MYLSIFELKLPKAPPIDKLTPLFHEATFFKSRTPPIAPPPYSTPEEPLTNCNWSKTPTELPAKSNIPSVSEFIGKPFQLTWFWLDEKPLIFNDCVEPLPPDCFIWTFVFSSKIFPIDLFGDNKIRESKLLGDLAISR